MLLRNVYFLSKNKIKNWELLIVDNKSNDKTVKIVKQIISKNKSNKNKINKNKENILYSGSSNKIIEKAKYDLIAIMDSDDQYLASDISKLYYSMRKNKLDLIFGKREIRRDTFMKNYFWIFSFYIQSFN